jgi:hypothetical protein
MHVFPRRCMKSTRMFKMPVNRQVMAPAGASILYQIESPRSFHGQFKAGQRGHGTGDNLKESVEKG